MKSIGKLSVVFLAVATSGFIGIDSVEARGGHGGGSRSGASGYSGGGRSSYSSSSGYSYGGNSYGGNSNGYSYGGNSGSSACTNSQNRKKKQQQNRHKNLKRYNKADTDGSGKLTSDEFRGSDQRFDRIDKNNDGEVGRREMNQAHKRTRQKNRFQTRDADGNNHISRSEFGGTDQQFAGFDRNGDGQISVGEYRLGLKMSE